MAERTKQVRHGIAGEAGRLDKAALVIRDLIRQVNAQAEELRVARERLTESERRIEALDTEIAAGMEAFGEQIAALVTWKVEQEEAGKVKRVARRQREQPVQ